VYIDTLKLNECALISDWAINPAGVVTGFYIDKSFLEHGFLRTP